MKYSILKSKRSKQVKILVHGDGRVVVTVPHMLRKPSRIAEKFIKEKEEWILHALRAHKKINNTSPAFGSRQHYLKHRESSRHLINQRIDTLNSYYNFIYKSISIRNQKTRWGSCSSKKNLNFNYKLLFLPDAICDYIIVHELCHLRELNHSSKFWELVAQKVPNYKQLRVQLKKYSREFV